ncbi:kinase-like protein [Thozetella sp. PMI_491]|nr:kinase-like protein [Thozetella sp. PMI_491]
MDSRNDELEQIFEQEAAALKKLRTVWNRHTVNSVGTILRGEKRYILFPWANGGNLRDFWTSKDEWPLTQDLLLQVIRQLTGVSDALDQLHENGWRHGDVKPENILRFTDNTILGTLKLGDMGLAKAHVDRTEFRSERTSTRVGTIRYEPPETITRSDQPRSRRYDIWSMGCIMLEFVIWILYGPNGLAAFNQDLFQNGTFQSFYLTKSGRRGDRAAQVHPAVSFWMSRILDDPHWLQGTLIRDLVTLIRNHLLVISVEPEKGNSSQPHRADAKALFEHLSRILGNSEDDSEYLFPQLARNRGERPPIPDYSTHIEPPFNSLGHLVPPQTAAALPDQVLETDTLEAPDVIVRPPTSQEY